ncbi:enoyl-CoA hydratase/isomerase family protein [Alteraurantiacibacter buctensis]|uniref:3-hydroxyisobutyryl-CoA hydrolase n=1 Tax=Alteraurantiacibacter buctensis TaxID=1503981 RepID=A0A844Z3A2_9SPHN|nr:enoyl-CoA hydratase/isomerase family protein [Alteraurantiacibacter buctensis]MXO73164.1 enoyl-CoA hydratase/isomerase family protein [Alteraurantiacibacter buctensis]
MPTPILASRTGSVGRLTLNRPRALHSLNQAMCDLLADALLEWRDDPAIEAVILDHAAATRGFCAGGDVVAVRQSVLDDGGAAARAFFLAEYRLNHLLYTYPKPVIACMDGVTMGGGVGLALPCTIRVATENTLLAMPEGAIGLFPDVGAGLYLSRLPGQLGKFLALTGARLDGAECLWAGLTTHYLASDDLEEAKAAIAREPAAADEILRDLSTPPPPARLERNAERIDRLFAHDTLEGILAALAADDSEWAAKEWKAVAAKCPATAKVALRQLATAPADFAAEMAREFALACRMIARGDFAEGVRAVLVEKDNAPRWQPATPEGVTPEMIDEVFAPLPDAEAWTPLAPLALRG